MSRQSVGFSIGLTIWAAKEITMSKKTYEDGRREGREWTENAKEHPIAHRIDPCSPSKPHESGNEDFNKGVEKGVEESGGKRWW
jgi:hypothetical protein